MIYISSNNETHLVTKTFTPLHYTCRHFTSSHLNFTKPHYPLIWLNPLSISWIYINNCPTRRNTKESIYYSASSLYMFRVSTTPIIRSTQNCNYSLRYWSYFCAATSLQRGQAWPRWSLATLDRGSCTVPEAVVTVLCTPDDGCGWHPKHVEWTCRIIYRLLCVASHWAMINIDQRCTEPRT